MISKSVIFLIPSATVYKDDLTLYAYYSLKVTIVNGVYKCIEKK